MTITLFIPCFIDLMYPQVGISMVRIFEKLGHQVVVPKSPAACAASTACFFFAFTPMTPS